tara:strand:+ start:4875 stop:5777 length:903 start_codon:yes stop_codon:yes gene_type:complete
MEYYDLLNYYYDLKNKYESKYEKKKRSIIQSDVPISQKKEEIRKIKRTCVVCKGAGNGMIFKKEKNILSVSCNANKPCSLDFRLELAKYNLFDDQLESYMKKIETIKQEIITLKLDLLFGLQSEEYVMNRFSNKKQNLLKFQKNRDKIMSDFNNKNNLFKLDINNEVNDYDKETSIKLYKGILENVLNSYKKNIDKYNKTKNKAFLKDAFDIYNNELLMYYEKLREIKYQTHFFESVDVDKNFPSKKTLKTAIIENCDLVPSKESTAKQSKMQTQMYPIKIAIENKEILLKKHKVLSNLK